MIYLQQCYSNYATPGPPNYVLESQTESSFYCCNASGLGMVFVFGNS